jgi:hypothetical protein
MFGLKLTPVSMGYDAGVLFGAGPKNSLNYTRLRHAQPDCN